MEITKKISDEICTAITLGHIVKYAEDNKKPVTIVYETKDEIQDYDSVIKYQIANTNFKDIKLLDNINDTLYSLKMPLLMTRSNTKTTDIDS